MEAKEIKRLMSPEKWGTKDPASSLIENDLHVFVCDTLAALNEGENEPETITYEECKANAAAIVSAVNNTWNQNINPEKVPELIKEVQALLNDMGGSGIYIDQRATIHELLTSAKL